MDKGFSLLKESFSFIIGVDLSGSERRKTGIAYIDDGMIRTNCLYFDIELTEIAKKFEYIYIDAPLTLPSGRVSIEERVGIHFRECDLKLRERKIKFFPITLGPMRQLTQRGMYLKDFWVKEGKKVYEVFPGAFYDVFGVKRKDKEGILKLFREIACYLELFLGENQYSMDELDAMACLFTGIFHRLNLVERLEGVDGCILIPSCEVKRLFRNILNPLKENY